jgi:hypothetical protein
VRGAGASEAVIETYHLSASQIETIHQSITTDGWAKTYRAIGIGESALRTALTGKACAQRTFELIRDYAARWAMSHGQEIAS